MLGAVGHREALRDDRFDTGFAVRCWVVSDEIEYCMGGGCGMMPSCVWWCEMVVVAG